MELYFATEHPLRFTIRADGLRRDGTEFVGEMSWGIVETEAGPLLLAIGRDMTAHREAMARLKRQSRQVAAVAALGERALSGADVCDLAAGGGRADARDAAAAARGREAGRRAAGRRGASTARARCASRSAPARRCSATICVVVDGDLGEDEENFLRGIANVLATAMGRLRGEERMRHDALHDPLTGLANRALCRERLIHALARSQPRRRRGVRAVHRPRRLQGRQRPLRPRRGRRAADRAGAAAGRDRAAGRHRGAARRRRVRGRVRGHRRGHGDRARRPPDRGDPRAARRRRDRAPAVGQHRDRARRGGAARPGPAARRRRRRRVPREGRGARPRRGVRPPPAPARARAAADGGGAGARAVARAAAAGVPADRVA